MHVKEGQVVSTTASQADAKIQSWFETANNICLAVTFLISLTILSAWQLPVVSSILPDNWRLMQASTGLAVLFLSTGLALGRQNRSYQLRLISQICAGAAILLAALALFEHWNGEGAIFGRYLVADSHIPLANPMSIQSAVAFILLGLLLITNPLRQYLPSYICDFILMLLIILNLLFISGYLFNAIHLIGQSSVILISVQTLACVVLLSFVQMGRCAPYGFFSALVTKGVGSRFARILLPFSIIISFLIIFGKTQLLTLGALTSPYDAALEAAALATLLFVVVIVLARKINALEKNLRDISLTDDLTKIFNRRGFYEHGEQELRDIQRNAQSLTLLFFDVDGLKKVNDTFGHEIGSQLLIDFATLLRKNFRENDIVARLGGDEFVVMTHGPRQEVIPALRRLREATDNTNNTCKNPYSIGFSMGEVTVDAQSHESLDELLAKADAAMYSNKQARRAGREAIGKDYRNTVDDNT
jgi:diguanylate cyclase (GGDEF)-like protein